MPSHTCRSASHVRIRFVSRQRARVTSTNRLRTASRQALGAGPSRRWMYSSDTGAPFLSIMIIGAIRTHNLHAGSRTSAFSPVFEAHELRFVGGLLLGDLHGREAARGSAIHEKPMHSCFSGASPVETQRKRSPLCTMEATAGCTILFRVWHAAFSVREREMEWSGGSVECVV